MAYHMHHVHIFATDIDESVRFYESIFDGKVILDTDVAGARNVFMRIGTGRLHFYAQPPRNPVRGNIHHFGIQTDDIEGAVQRLQAHGVELKDEITDLGAWRYLMVLAPDDILIELFEIRREAIPIEFLDFFE